MPPVVLIYRRPCTLIICRPRRIHEREITAARRQHAEFKDAAEEKAGRWEYEIKMLEGDLTRSKDSSQVVVSILYYICSGTAKSGFGYLLVKSLLEPRELARFERRIIIPE